MTANSLTHVIAIGLLVLLAAFAPLLVFRRRAPRETVEGPWLLTIFFLLLSASFLGASLPAVLQQLNVDFWRLLLGYVALLLLIQAGCIYLLLRFVKQILIATPVFVAVVVLNAFATYIVLREDFHELAWLGQAGIIFLLAVAVAVLFQMAAGRSLAVKKLNAVLAVIIVAPVAVLIPRQMLSRPDTSLVDRFSGIEFRSRPNVHILGFDSMTPPSLAAKYLKLDNLGYAPLLQRDGTIAFRNAFASNVPTKRSLNSIMRLAHPGLPEVYEYFAGRIDSPLARVFRSNGYKFLTGFDNLYFGAKGPYVDDFYPQTHEIVSENALCALAVDNPLKFFGFCELMKRFEAREKKSWPETVSERIRSAARRPEPWITFTHIYNPIGHTSKDYQSSDKTAFEKFRAGYRKRAERAAGIAQSIADSLLNDNGKSVLLMIGDHGPWISRTADPEKEAEFVVQDRHGIVAAILVNETDCKRSDFEHYATSYITPERILAGLIRCLAKEPEKVDAAVAFEETGDLKQYLYE